VPCPPSHCFTPLELHIPVDVDISWPKEHIHGKCKSHLYNIDATNLLLCQLNNLANMPPLPLGSVLNAPAPATLANNLAERIQTKALISHKFLSSWVPCQTCQTRSWNKPPRNTTMLSFNPEKDGGTRSSMHMWRGNSILHCNITELTNTSIEPSGHRPQGRETGSLTIAEGRILVPFGGPRNSSLATSRIIIYRRT
jgi:hypothetical protein